MRTHHISFFIVALLLLATGLTACGNNAANPSAADTKISGSDAKSADSAQDLGSEGISASDIALFEEYMKNYEKSLLLNEYMVAYDLKNLFEGDAVVKEVIYKKGANERADMSSIQFESRGITTKEKSTSCIKDLQSGQSEWTCFEVMNKEEALSSAKDVDVSVTTSEEEISQEKVIFKKDGTISIAGTTADCWLTQRPADKSSDRICISDEGIMLYSRFDVDGNVTEISATAYSLSVNDDVFVVPQGAKVETTADLIKEMGLSCSDCELMPDESKADCLANCN